MIKEGIEKILSLASPTFETVEGRKYSDRQLFPVNPVGNISELEFNTLGSITDFIQSYFIDNGADINHNNVYLHIENEKSVRLFSELDKYNKRQYYCSASFQPSGFNFDYSMSQEDFIISVGSSFVDCPNKIKVLELASNIVDDDNFEYSDNGLVQSVQVRQGVAKVGVENFKNPVNLMYRCTFPEVSQPERDFILRVSRGAKLKIVQTTDTNWKLKAIESIKSYYLGALGAIGADFVKILSLIHI